jgi:hypothetical protein
MPEGHQHGNRTARTDERQRQPLPDLTARRRRTAMTAGVGTKRTMRTMRTRASND